MKLLNFFSKKKNNLIFSLICGLAYLACATGFSLRHTANVHSGFLLAMFFSPTIICGAAVVIFKAIQSYAENQATKQFILLFVVHIFVILFGIISIIGSFI